ncbi:MAG: primase [Candidatus Saccharibacteria bacterium]|nr:primase [Candidatus Saccharibacteria bacterium]
MDAVDEVKSRLSVEDVVGEYVQLKRTGRNYKGLSPFANEKTPSFVVSPEKQIWHDFSSGRGGDMFSFVMEVEGLDFRGALDLLARKAGIDLEQFGSRRGGPKGPDKERLYQLLDLSTKFYQVQFSKSKIALEYALGRRGFSKETALEWRLGYSPNNGSALVDFAKSKGYSDEEIQLAGLSAQRYRGVSDMFRGRLMIPLQDAQGKVIGFTARLLTDDKNAPKYINTPQTPLYDKSRHVFGLHLAKESIRRSTYVVIAEGNLDVITSHQAGVRQVVATAGTALTEPHLKALGRFTGDIRLSFDADRAGLAATERAIPIASKVKVSLSIITIPSGKDPDELIRQDAAAWQQAIDTPQYAIDWLIERYQGLLDITSAEGKRKFTDQLLPTVKALTDPVEADHYLTQIASLVAVSKQALEQKMLGTVVAAEPPKKQVKPPAKPTDKQTLERQKTQDTFLCLMLIRPTLREFLDLMTPEMFITPPATALLAFLKANPDFYGKPEQLAKLTAVKPSQADPDDRAVQSLQDYVKIETLLYEELYQGLELNELHYEAARLQVRLVEQFVKTQKQILVSKITAASDAEARELLNEVKTYDELLKSLKGNTARAETL